MSILMVCENEDLFMLIQKGKFFGNGQKVVSGFGSWGSFEN